MTSMKIGSSLYVLAISMVLAFAQPLMAASGGNGESKKFIEYFKKKPRANIRKIVDDLYWAGVTDTRLYDMIESELLLKHESQGKIGVEVSSWLVKALAVSGNKKYLRTMEKINASAAHKKLKKHTTGAMETLGDYARWLPVMNKGVKSLRLSKRGQARTKNMLNSGDSEFIRIGAQRVYHDYTSDPVLLKQVEKVLLAGHNKGSDATHVDAMAWLIKALAESMNVKYKKTLEKVAAETNNKRVKKYAVKYGSYLQ